MKVYVSVGDSDVYPDVSVVCGQPEFVGDGSDVIAKAAAIVEVLSDTTELFVSTRSSYVLGERHQFAWPR